MFGRFDATDRRRELVLIGLAVLFVTLAGSCKSSPAAPSLSLEGTWNGTLVTPGGGGSLKWELAQESERISGTVTSQDLNGIVGRGTITGTLSDTTLTFEMTFPPGAFSPPFQSCSQTVTGSALNVTRSLINGSYSGTIRCPNQTSGGSGQFTLTR
jgi:hypothetical protein